MKDTTIRASLDLYNYKEREKKVRKDLGEYFINTWGELHLCYRNKFQFLFK